MQVDHRERGVRPPRATAWQRTGVSRLDAIENRHTLWWQTGGRAEQIDEGVADAGRGSAVSCCPGAAQFERNRGAWAVHVTEPGGGRLGDSAAGGTVGGFSLGPARSVSQLQPTAGSSGSPAISGVEFG